VLSEENLPAFLRGIRTVGKPNKISEQEAEVALQLVGRQEPVTLKIRQMDGAWRIEDLRFAADQEEAIKKFTAVLPELARALQGVAEQIEKGELASAVDAQQALEQAIKDVLAQGPAPESSKKANTAQKPKKRPDNGASPNRPKAQPRSPRPNTGKPPQGGNDELDGVYTGPNQLRRR